MTALRVSFGATAAAVFAFAAWTLPARADLVPDGNVPVPVELTIDGQGAFPDTSFVLLGCHSDRHQLGFVKPNEPLRCKTKMPATVYAVPTKDVKPLHDLFAKEVGWGTERSEAEKLLEKTPTCSGKITENTLVDRAKSIDFLSARYALEKTATGCSIKKVGETVPHSSSGPGPASAAPPVSPPVTTKSACSASVGPISSAPLVGFGLAASSLLRRRSRRSSLACQRSARGGT
jgi:hypothetical protein